MTNDEKYMMRCIQLAKNGRLGTAPNPMVGAVVVCQGKIIGEGYHAKCGEAHAEVNAIASVKDKESLKQSTIYVSLEPCAHYGKTPPCANLIVDKGIPKVVIGCQDPFSKVAGRGIEILRNAGCEVIVGVLEKECIELNKVFFTVQLKRRPFVTLKWAQSADCYLDIEREGGTPVLLSSPYTQMIAHKRRAEHQAILVGTRTALLDNPSLNVRAWCGPQPLRIVIDRQLSLPRHLRLFDGSQSTLVVTEKDDSIPGCMTFRADFSQSIIPQLMEELVRRNVHSLLVEGGSVLLQSFLDEGFWDEAYVEHSPLVVKHGILAPSMAHLKKTSKKKLIMGRNYHIFYNFV
ncbi:MAG: bifunctional diaminohydroxyphosphoribosylaminopyrimidine deaminase/5-amino-6-(5-phosphoribosylamino)uracil reductase RibD [Bacteroidaceae bacterium]|nr:bifunctional diaminohydroxyphosphoribosylaminopyrimidine deaminase/5-amino-6-(5-phosphoribosylamino)uracil reductase RibD [Bacteroidaceae bacterium]